MIAARISRVDRATGAAPPLLAPESARRSHLVCPPGRSVGGYRQARGWRGLRRASILAGKRVSRRQGGDALPVADAFCHETRGCLRQSRREPRRATGARSAPQRAEVPVLVGECGGRPCGRQARAERETAGVRPAVVVGVGHRHGLLRRTAARSDCGHRAGPAGAGPRATHATAHAHPACVARSGCYDDGRDTPTSSRW